MQNNDLQLTVNEESTGKRLDIFVAESVDPMSRARAGKLIDSGAVTLDGKISRCSRRVKQGDKIAVSIPPPASCDIEPESLDLDIVFEDEHIAIIDKPVGMVVHPSPGHAKGTLVNGLLYAMKGSLSGIGGVERPGIVHRLDKDTSGLIAVAKTDQSHQSLSDQLKSKSMGRIYIAVVHGRPKNEAGRIETMIGRHPRDRKKMANLEEGGRVAISEYKTISTIEKLSVVTVALFTGRTHQVRLHMLELNTPVAGDAMYGRGRVKTTINRQALHAAKMTLVHPVTNEKMEFMSPFPDDIKTLIKSVGGDPDLIYKKALE